MGVVVAQMSKIDRVVRPGHANMLRKKACLCQGLAIAILVVGTYRFLQEQSAVNGTGKRASQWSLLAAGFLILGVSTSIANLFTMLMTSSCCAVFSPSLSLQKSIVDAGEPSI